MPKLLVVDASPMMHRIMELTFAPEGIQVVTVSDGDQAIALLPIARPDLVIADHAVPGRNGYEVAAFVRTHHELAGTPVLLLASPFEPLDRGRADACGVAGEIAKPFEPAQLVARVRDLLSRAPLRQADEASSAPERLPALKLVEPVVAPARGALDDYFDRLDAALGRLDEQMAVSEGSDRLPSVPDGLPEEDRGVPTVDRLLGDQRSTPRGAVLIEHPLRGAYADVDGSGVGTASGAEATAPSSSPGRDLGALVDALEALRRGSPEAATTMPPAPAEQLPSGNEPATALSEATLDEITKRVVERLAPGAVNDVVVEVVTKVAERLLREEIARLSKPSHP
jgi:CheY-like chemotaxis protein